MIPLLAQLTNSLTTVPITNLAPFADAKKHIQGWSLPEHYIFFRHLVSLDLKSILVCGVYHGMDLALLAAAAKLARRDIKLTGVDLFQDAPCADWPEVWRENQSWEAAGIGPPPSIEIARANVPSATLVQGDATKFMLETDATFDVIYLDTSHDEWTCRHEIEAARRVLNKDGILCGDDYRDDAALGWGVDLAVQALLPNHILFWNRIWASR